MREKYLSIQIVFSNFAGCMEKTNIRYVTPEDIPEIYGKILQDWLAKGKKGYGFAASTEQANQ